MQRLAPEKRRRPRAGKRDGQRRIGTEPAEIRRAVDLAQCLVDAALVDDIAAAERRLDLVRDIGDRLQHTAPLEKVGIAVAQLMRLVAPGRGAGGHARPPERPVL